MVALWSWVRNIILVLLMILGVELLMPQSTFRPYLRLVAGLILVLVVLEPVVGWLGGRMPELGAVPLMSPPGRAPGGAEEALARRVRAEVDRQVREALGERLEAAVREVVLDSGVVSWAQVEVRVGEGPDVAEVRVRVKAGRGGRLSPQEREHLREAVASYLGISRTRVRVEEG